MGQPLRALPFLLLEGLGSLLPLALLLGLFLWGRDWKRNGELAAFRSLALPPFWNRIGLLLGALPFVLLYSWVLQTGRPMARQALWSSGPKLLHNLEDPRDLSRAVAGGLGIGLAARTLKEGKLEKVCAYLPLGEDKGLSLRAEVLTLRPSPQGFRLHLRGARVSQIDRPQKERVTERRAQNGIRELAAFRETTLFFDPGLARRVGPLPPEILGSPLLQEKIPELVRLAARNALGKEAVDTALLESRYKDKARVRKGKVLLLLLALLLGLLLSISSPNLSHPVLLSLAPLLLFILLSRIHPLLSTLGRAPSWVPAFFLLPFLLLRPKGTAIL